MRVSANRYAPRALIAMIAAFGVYGSMIKESRAFQKLDQDDGCQSWVTDKYSDIKLPDGHRIFVQVPCGTGFLRESKGRYTAAPSGDTMIMTETKYRFIKTFQWDGGDQWILIKVEPLKNH